MKQFIIYNNTPCLVIEHHKELMYKDGNLKANEIAKILYKSNIIKIMKQFRIWYYCYMWNEISDLHWSGQLYYRKVNCL